MATFLPARHGVSYSEAYAEAIIHAPADRVMIETLEMRHSGFRDDSGAPYAIRVVSGHEDVTATLEATAPIDPGETVVFEALPYRVSGPDETDTDEAPTITLAIDGVSALVVPQLDAAVQTLEPVMLTVRYYVSTDLSTPAILPPLTMTLFDVEVGETQITARGGIYDPANKLFPRKTYTLAEYPGLAA